MNVKIKLLTDNATIPKKSTENAGAWDCTITEIIKESPDYVRCKLGFALQPPPNYRVVLVPRSSITKTKWILSNSIGIGDSDYFHEYEARFRCLPSSVYIESNLEKGNDYGRSYDYIKTENNIEYESFPYEVGDRCIQLFLEEIIPIEFEEVPDINQTTNRIGGFGSTGMS